MTKNEFIKALALHSGRTLAQTTEDVDFALGVISQQLKDGEDIILQDFGKLTVKTLKARKGHHPLTGAPIEIPEHDVVRFKPFAGLLTYAHKHQ